MTQIAHSHPALGDIETFIRNNMGLVMKSAARYSRLTGVDYEDLVSEGTIGLMMAYTRFDEKKGYAFSTLGVRYINGYILTYLRSNGRTIRVPTHIFEVATSIYKRRWENEPAEFIAKQLKIPVSYAEQALEHAAERTMTSLDAPIDDVDTPLGTLIPSDEDYTDIHVKDFLDTLSQREKEYIQLISVGFNQREIGRKYNITHQAVSLKIKIVKEKAKAYFGK
ncbi:sigma-70 family RNA polymerase sigma factor [Paenibacillus sp. MER 180]|uniref:sigma-70 family RNA polymerase sigma factor n=1 Tax=Paenibacillus sp. MER 180 TaxID=2939570 RepID=UPI00203A637C|nr:sigma-70 family RNA polymerase sigma factor [Paenibacillus sp. MER 180]MCM3294226.1 sigma-70 family RNA polymerase sigma factor [Paenibacillus sp. MER 180]